MAKNKIAKKQKKWRFYRSNLSTIVWDPQKDKPLADFSAGYFTTADPVVAEKLSNLGYYEIPLDSTEPPLDIIINKPATIIHGDVPVMKSAAMGEKIMEARMTAVTEEVNIPGIKIKPEKLKVKETKVKDVKAAKRKKRKV